MKKDVLLILTVLTLPLLFHNSFVLSIAITALIYSILSLSWLFLDDRAGWISLAHSIPFGFAAYAVAINPVLLIPAFTASLIIFILISLIGREKFAFASFIIGVLVWYLSHYLTLGGKGGEEGFCFQPLPAIHAYVAATSALLLSLTALVVVSRSALGLRIAAVRDDEIAARSVGIDVFHVRVVAFTVSMAVASLAGVCYVAYFGHASPELFSAEVALLPFVAGLIAGKRWISPLAGSYVIVILSIALGNVLPGAHLLLYAAVLALSPRIRRWWNAEGH